MDSLGRSELDALENAIAGRVVAGCIPYVQDRVYLWGKDLADGAYSVVKQLAAEVHPEACSCAWTLSAILACLCLVGGRCHVRNLIGACNCPLEDFTRILQALCDQGLVVCQDDGFVELRHDMLEYERR